MSIFCLRFLPQGKQICDLITLRLTAVQHLVQLTFTACMSNTVVKVVFCVVAGYKGITCGVGDCSEAVGLSVIFQIVTSESSQPLQLSLCGRARVVFSCTKSSPLIVHSRF